MSARAAARLAWGIGLFCAACVVASLVLLAIDWKAIDSPGTALLPYFLAAPVSGILGVLIATRRPSQPIGWFLLAIAAFNVVSLTADFAAVCIAVQLLVDPHADTSSAPASAAASATVCNCCC